MNEIRPDKIMQLAFAYMPQRALVTAVDLGLFTHLAHGKHTAAELAAAAGADERGVRMVLDALTAVQLLTKNDSTYHLTPETETFLVRSNEAYLGDTVHHTDAMWDTFGKLTEVVRTGHPLAADEEAHGPEFFEQMVSQIFGMSYPAARVAAEKLGIGDSWRGATVLDVGAGSGAWSLAMLERDPSARARAQDWPNVLAVTRRFVERFGFTDRYEYLPGNMREVDFEEGTCDLAILGQICHSEGAEHSQDLFRKLHRALRPGGKLLIADMVPDEGRSSAAFPLFFALNMLVHTAQGDTFTLSEYTKWLTDAGFRSVSTLEAPGPSPLIVAER